MSRRGPRSRVLTVLLMALCSMLALSCSTAETPPPQGPPATGPEEPPAPPPPPPMSPFTGMPADLAAPVLAVKIDNAPPARPQSGLALADVVYLEPVEGGVSRLLAVYHSQLPPTVGPVRSARESDLQLLANYGHPALAFSGEAPELRPLIAQSPVLDVSHNARPAAYHRDRGRPAPHNLYADPHQLRAGAAPPKDIGFVFGPPPPGGQPVPGTDVHYQLAHLRVDWAPAENRWVMSMDGAPLTTAAGTRVGAATVVLQRVPVHATNIRDAAGSVSPFAATVGQGDAVVLRDGHSFAGHWSRPAPQDPTSFTLPDGSPLPFAPGNVWVVLVPA